MARRHMPLTIKPLIQPPALWLLAGFALFAWSSSQWQFATGIDDAHISFFAAHTLASAGEILNYNGERVEQSSSLLHVLLTALLSRITQANTVTCGYLIPLLSGWLCLPVLWRYTKQEQLGPAVLLCATPALVYWTYAGLETALFALLLLWHIHCLASQKTRWFTLIASGAALQMTRPELPLFVPVLTLVFSLLCRATGSLSYVAISRCLLSIAIALCIFAWRKLYFGDLFPQPVVAKTAGITLTTLKAGVIYVGQVFTHPASAVMAACSTAATLHPLWRGIRSQESTFVTASALTCIGYVLLVVLIGGDWMPNQRFFAPLVPLQALLVTRSLTLLLPTNIALLAVLTLAVINCTNNTQLAKIHSPLRDEAPLANQQYSYFELHSPDNRANLPTLDALIPWISKIQAQKNSPYKF